MSHLRKSVTLSHQCWAFAVGSTFFAVATAPGLSTASVVANALCFVGSWFFTGAAWIQLNRSGPDGSLEWCSAATQFIGTVLFNVSTGTSVWAHALASERGLVWAPDATGSVAFLVSGVLGIVAASAAVGSRDWQAEWVNMMGCAAFGVSAAGAFVATTGTDVDVTVANVGTFVGALCFLAAALLVLPRRKDVRRPR